MVQLSSAAVSIMGEEITVDANAVAQGLGLSVDALREEMAKGLVTGVAESGIDENAGRTRLTFRHQTKIWRLVVEPDGTLVEDAHLTEGSGDAGHRFDLHDLIKSTP